MPSWSSLLHEFDAHPNDQDRGNWLKGRLCEALKATGQRRGGRNVLVYASGFLQKPQAPASTLQITGEDLNGFMACLYGMTWSRGLTLILHTPGGATNATETIVAYLRSKFDYIEVIVPAFAMSAGSMISLAADRIVMGRQSQLGPIDPQSQLGGRAFSAQGVVDQFERAKAEIQASPVSAHAWAPVLATIGPALLQEARNALAYGETMVAGWLKTYMYKGLDNPDKRASLTAAHFNAATLHKSHGRRIDRGEARANGVVVDDLEADQTLQEEVLTAYHLITILFEKSPAAKLMINDSGAIWVKNLPTPPPAPPATPTGP